MNSVCRSECIFRQPRQPKAIWTGTTINISTRCHKIIIQTRNNYMYNASCTTSIKWCFEMKSVVSTNAGKCYETHEYRYCQKCMGISDTILESCCKLGCMSCNRFTYKCVNAQLNKTFKNHKINITSSQNHNS